MKELSNEINLRRMQYCHSFSCEEEDKIDSGLDLSYLIKDIKNYIMHPNCPLKAIEVLDGLGLECRFL